MKRFATLAIAIAFAALPLAACANSGGAGSSASSDAQPASSASSAPAPVDTSSWTTLGDALATADAGESISYGQEGSLFACVFKSGGSTIRTVSEWDSALDGKFADLEFGSADYNEKFTAIVKDLKLKSAEDITASLMSQSDVQSYVGKTGKELIDEGFVFESYFLYGGEQTGATMAKDFFTYSVTFDTQVSESQTEDGGAAIMDAKVVEISSDGNLSNIALDPAL